MPALSPTMRALFLAMLPLSCAGAPQFPDQGYSYISGRFMSRIFDLSITEGTVKILNDVEWPKPRSVDKVTPSLDCSMDASSTSTSSVTEESSRVATDYSSKWGRATTVQAELKGQGIVPKGWFPSGGLGYEAGGSRDSSASFARESMMARASSIIKTEAKCEFAQVIMREPIKADLSQDFMEKLYLLPEMDQSWASSGSSREKSSYRRFLNTFGTHYVHAGTLGGSYEGVTAISQCTLTSQSKTASDYARCVNSKFTASVKNIPIQAIVGVSSSVSSEESACDGMTKDGSLSSEFSDSSVTTRSTWIGGSMMQTDAITSESIKAWLEDVVENPKVWPQSLKAISDLVYDISLAMGSNIECMSCTNLENLGLTKAGLRKRSDALEHAMLELFTEALADEGTCTLKCGHCQTDAPDSCACPPGSASECAAGGPAAIQTRIDSMKVETSLYGFSAGYNFAYMQLRLSGLDDLDGKHGVADKAALSYTISMGSTFDRSTGEFFTVDVWNVGSDQEVVACMGSARVFFHKLEFGKQIQLLQDCSDGTPRDTDCATKVTVQGCATNPSSCDADAPTCDDEVGVEVASASNNKGIIVVVLLVVAHSFY